MKLLIGIALAVSLVGCESAYANTPMDDIKGIHAVLGEARGESYEAQLAIAHAIRNRSSFRGVYGVTARIADVDGETYQRASKAWHEALETPDLTNGATHWLSDWDLAHCKPSRIAWHNAMIKTAYIGHFTFYKERV